MTASLWSPFPTASWVASYVRCGCRRQLNRHLYPSRLAAVKPGRARMSRLQWVTAGNGGWGKLALAGRSASAGLGDRPGVGVRPSSATDGPKRARDGPPCRKTVVSGLTFASKKPVVEGAFLLHESKGHTQESFPAQHIPHRLAPIHEAPSPPAQTRQLHGGRA
jgi:hypothetical protein